METDGGDDIFEKEPLRKNTGTALVLAGSTLNVCGAVLNSVHMRLAFPIWLVSNLLCAAYFCGAWRKVWRVDTLGDLQMLAMYLIFTCTALNGWLH